MNRAGSCGIAGSLRTHAGRVVPRSRLAKISEEPRVLRGGTLRIKWCFATSDETVVDKGGLQGVLDDGNYTSS
jgi:hypothetical protein